MKFASTLAFAAGVAALPAPQAGTSEPLRFAGMSLRSASPIHFGQINANGQAFWIGKPTTTYCPDESVSTCDSTNKNTTIFTYLNGQKTLGLSTVVPGGQQVYVAEGDDSVTQAAGQLRFTQAHSAGTSGPPLYEGFAIVYDGKLQFEGKDWIACPGVNSSYAVYAESRIKTATDDCLGFTWKIEQLDDSTPAAWQYVK